MTIDITPVLNAVVALLAALVSAVFVPWLRSKLGAEKMAEFLRWVEIGVAAAEQLYSHTDTEEKKSYVMGFLKKKGFDVDTEEVDNAIEAAVLKLHKEMYYD